MTERIIWRHPGYKEYTHCAPKLLLYSYILLLFPRLCSQYLSSCIFRVQLSLSACFCSYTDACMQISPLSGTYALQLHLVSSESHFLHSPASTQCAYDVFWVVGLIFSVLTSKKELYCFFYLFTRKGGSLSNILMQFWFLCGLVFFFW